MRFLIHISICATALFITGCGQTDPCDCDTITCATFTEDQTLAGEISIDSFKLNEQSTPYQPYILKLDQNICVTGTDQFGPQAPEATTYGPLTKIQLAGNFDRTQVLDTIGRQASVKGQLFAQFSQWHVTPVLIDVTDVSSRLK